MPLGGGHRAFTFRDTLRPIIKRKFVLDVFEFQHFHINHSKLFADRYNHTNGIEHF